MNWDDMRYFLAIARARTLSAAARQLNVSQPTVSRRLTGMEAQFGVKLFERTNGGYELSAPGADILETVQHVEEELNGIDRKVFGQDWRLSGRLRVTCTEVLANRYLTPHLARFLEEHPDIDLSILCTFQHLSLSRREADIAIRVTNRPPDTLVGRRLVKTALAVYSASPDYEFFKNAAPSRWDWIGWQDEAYNRMLITGPFPDAQIRHRVDDMQAMRSMVRSRLGVAILPTYLADPDPTLRRIVEEPVEEIAPDLWILTHPDVRRVARVRIFTDFIAKTIIADRDLFEGRRPSY
jgi:DNA-binding transcriptional LysR family regulator